MRLTLIAGARPNFMKIAPLARALEEIGTESRIVHTGQHYDRRMSGDFFEELGIPEPGVNLGVQSGSHIRQIAEVMQRLEEEYTAHRPDAVVVVGDVNSTLAATLTATKMDIPCAHVEAGLRSFDRTMPEETNRIVVDALAGWLFTSEPAAAVNLNREGVADDRIHFVGNVMIDTLLHHLDAARDRRAFEQFDLDERNYVLVTLHRPSNVDHRERLASILDSLNRVADRFPVLFPLHPRTRKQIQQFGLEAELDRIRTVEPQGYLAMLSLMDGARLVMTDSGGIQEETTALRIPCLTLRENTERPITVEVGSNRLIGCETESILAHFAEVCGEPERIGAVPELWDGQAAQRIAKILSYAADPAVTS